MVDILDNVEGKEVDGIVKGGRPGNQDVSETRIVLKEVKQPVGDVGQTWVVIHGNESTPDGENIGPLIEQVVAKAEEGDRVIALDWSEAAALTGGTVGVGGGNGVSATWIGPTAEETVKILESEFGIDPASASQQLNLVGHSLGSFMSAEIGRLYELGENRLGQEVTTANGKGVRTITALDPASSTNVPGGYDLEGRKKGRQGPDKFLEVSEFSRSFVGDKSISGSKEFADNADEAYLLDFGSADLNFGEHGRVVRAFANIFGNTSKIGELLGYDSYQSLDTLSNEEFGELQDSSEYFYQGNIKVNENNLPIQLLAKAATDNNDNIVVGDFLADDNIIVGDFLADEINGAAENDSLFGEAGNDTLIGDLDLDLDSQVGNDTLNGGEGNDILIGRRGNDSLVGGNDNDRLSGGFGNDVLNGGNGIDTAVFSDDFENYKYSIDSTKKITFDHLQGTKADGKDTLENIEFAQFSDRRVALPLNNIEGAEIQLQSFSPNLQTPTSVPVTAIIGDGIEFGTARPLPGNNLATSYTDITGGVAGGASIRYEINDLTDTSLLAADFNGIVLTDISDEIPPIENVTIDESENTLGLASSDITFSENTIEMNLEGLPFEPGDGFLLNVEFADV